MKWDSSDHNRVEVVDYTPFYTLREQDELMEREGVFIISDPAEEVLYVGRASPGRVRSRIEDVICTDECSNAAQVKALYTNNDALASSLLNKLILKYNPRAQED